MKDKNAGKLKPYLIFGLCDETFSVVHSAQPPEGVDQNWFSFFVTLLNHTYWVLGSAIGGLLGSVISINTTGLDFVLTALFVVIFVSHWKSQENRKAAVIGVVCSVICLALLGQSNFLIPAMILILVVLTIVQKDLKGKSQLTKEGTQ